MNKKILFLIVAAGIAAAVIGCTKKNVKVLLSETEYIQKVDSLYQNGKYDTFREEAQYFLSDFPGSSHAPEVQFLIAESYFNKKKYEESIAAYQRLIDKYPGSAYVDDSYYRIGKAYYAQKSIPERDQESTKKAIYYFDKVMRMDSPFKDEAAALNKDCRNTLALKEYYIARFYLKTKHYDISLQIIDKALKEYDDTGAVHMLNYMKAYNYYATGEKDKALAVLNTVDMKAVGEKMGKKITKLNAKIRKMR